MLWLLLGCSSGPSPSSGATVTSLSQNQQTPDALQQAEYYASLAQKNPPPKAYQYRLKATEFYLAANQPDKAKAMLDQLPDSGLQQKFEDEKHIFLAHYYIQTNTPKETLKALDEVSQLHTLSAQTQETAVTLRALAYEQLGDTLRSAQARAKLDLMLSQGAAKETNQNALWRQLSEMDIHSLKQATTPSYAPLDSWAALARIMRTEQVATLDQSLRMWRSQHPNHPAQAYIRSQKHAPASYAQQHPQQVALLLPLQGKLKKASEAIRDGFLTKYYEDDVYQSQKPSVKIYDTTNANIKVLYQQATSEGADFVIGPLEKEQVLSLSRLSSYQMKAPILALNHNRKIQRSPSNFYQFALDPEDEAEQIAQKIWQEGYRKPGIIVPSNAWGQRIIDAFTMRWQAIGGQTLTSVKLSSKEDKAKAVRQLLRIDSSQQRSKLIKNSIREKVNYQVRRRQDMDVIVMAAPPEQARQIKPLLDFYFAQDLPVYATSSVYIGQPTPNLDKDINGVIFCDMPWLLMSDQKSYATKAMIKKHWPAEANMYARLFAMGVDAYELSAEIQTLKQHPYRVYQGATGLLTLGPDQRIDRQLVWAQFKRGVPKLLQ